MAAMDVSDHYRRYVWRFYRIWRPGRRSFSWSHVGSMQMENLVLMTLHVVSEINTLGLAVCADGFGISFRISVNSVSSPICVPVSG